MIFFIGMAETHDYSAFKMSSCADLVKELLASCAGLDGKLQLSVHRSDANIYLKRERDKKRISNHKYRLYLHLYNIAHIHWYKQDPQIFRLVLGQYWSFTSFT